MGLPTSLSVQVQLAESVLGVLVSGFCGLREIFYRFDGVLLYDFASEVLFPQAIGGAVAPMVGGIL